MTIAKYYKIEQQKLFLEFEKISLFTKHNPTLGSYRENVLKNYIRKLVPKHLAISSGFISKHSDKDKNIYKEQSRQIDCLVYDNLNYTPLIETEQFSVITPDSVYSCIEVKSSLTFYKKYRPEKSKEISDEYPLGGGYTEAFRWAGTLVDSLINIKAAVDVCNMTEKPPIMSIFAYSYNFDLNNFSQALENNELKKQLGLEHLRQLPIYICVPGAFTIIFSHLDILVQDCVHEEHRSYYFELNGIENHEQYPLQWYSVLLNIKITFKLNGKQPDKGGMFSITPGNARMKSIHFHLSSEGE